MLYQKSSLGQPPIPPAQLALATVLQAYVGVSDDEVIEVLTAVADPILAIAKQVEEQDVLIGEEGKVSLVKGVARDRRISVEDGQMRHGCMRKDAA